MKTISLPFRLDGYGHVAATTDMSKIWADRVRSVVATSLGERLMRPSFGSPTPIHLFRNTEDIQSIMDVDVASAFQQWLPSLTYLGMTFDEVGESAEVLIEIQYGVPGIAESISTVNIMIEVD